MRRVFRVFNALLAVIALLLATHSALPVSAQGSAYNTNFITSITYQNVGTAPANITFTFYPTSGGQSIPITRTLAANAGASLFVGSTSELSNFSGQGSAVISSDQPIVATVVQLPQNPSVRNRPLSNGFGSNDGSTKVLIATVLKKKFYQTTKFSIQNADTKDVNVMLKIFPVGSATPTYTVPFPLKQGTARFFDAGTLPLRDGFSGSATIEADGKVVATAIELATDTSHKVSAFEGVAQGSYTVYMPSALCKYSRTKQSTAYAVQNTSTTSSATVAVTYKDTNNNTVATQTATIDPNAKVSFLTCKAFNDASFIGSATITSQGAPIVAIGKVFSENPAYAALATAFVGASAGASKLAAPYVRWTKDFFNITGNRQRAYIAIQNVGSGLSGDITVKYYDLNGNLVGTHTIPSIQPGQKANSTPVDASGDENKLKEFGYDNGRYGGSAIIECANCQIVAVVRIASANSATDPADIVAEDYNAIPIN